MSRIVFIFPYEYQRTMFSEKELIRICRQQVEQKFNFPQNENWKQRDFDYLSDLIFEKTQVRISISTLKRIWKEGNGMPQTFTLNALVAILGYESWTDFKRANAPATETRKGKETVKKTNRPYFLLAGLALLIVAIFIFFPRRNNTLSSENSIVFKSKKNLPAGVPNTVVFEYDISKMNFDSALIQQSWDVRMRAGISKNNRFQTFIYYYPGYHSAKLILDNKIVKQIPVNITTKGWEALVDGYRDDRIPQYIPKDSITRNNKLYVSKQTLLNNGINVEDKDFFVNYFNVGNFSGAEAANFSLETRIKNNQKEGGLVCQYTQVTLICENGMISIPFCNPGCASNIHLHVSDVLMEGKKNDLSAFGLDLSVWQNIQIKSINQQVTVYVNGHSIYSLPYAKDLGKITGFHYKFYGCGAVETVRLFDAKGRVCYEQ
ncbi:MAG: hypothetical protein ABI581_02975 [Sediminibacterium sp.]